MELQSSGKLYVEGLGNIFIIDLFFNKLPRFKKNINNVLTLGKEVTIDDIPGTIKNVLILDEDVEERVHNTIGIKLNEV